ncbi:hypothetical protein PAT3040_04625 [Paenibacillus agaridevorans]|uniref:Uncharacterized protein n=1 Tax=Paenibacillus agaridevorans TaxID=171404 RepID=A0A2R5ETC8_9BACL|nr:hypothetical protein PAT3040_04625 [Paenibacillus agaridevorans]
MLPLMTIRCLISSDGVEAAGENVETLKEVIEYGNGIFGKTSRLRIQAVGG